MCNKPTSQQIVDARNWLIDSTLERLESYGGCNVHWCSADENAVRVLIAATEPPKCKRVNLTPEQKRLTYAFEKQVYSWIDKVWACGDEAALAQHIKNLHAATAIYAQLMADLKTYSQLIAYQEQGSSEETGGD